MPSRRPSSPSGSPAPSPCQAPSTSERGSPSNRFPREPRPDRALSKAVTRVCSPAGQLLVLQGDGLHREPSGSFLKCELVTKSVFRYLGSVTIVVTTSHSSWFGAAKRSKYSVTTASSLYGTPFLRSQPAVRRVVTTFRFDPGTGPVCA